MKKIILYSSLLLVASTGFLFAQNGIPFKSKLSVKALMNAPAKLIPFPKSVVWEEEYLEIK